MSSERHIQIVPSNEGDLIQGFPGIPTDGDYQPGAKLQGEVQISLPLLGVAASKVEIKFQKLESIKIKGQQPITTTDVLNGIVLLHTKRFRQEETDVFAGRFPFSITIPEDLPPSVSMKDQGVEIQYSLHATVHRDNEIKFWKEKPFACTLPIEITKYDHHPAWPIYHQPEPKQISSENMRFSVQPIRTCYSPGEPIALNINLSCKSASAGMPRTVRFKAKFLQQLITTAVPSKSKWQLLSQSDRTPSLNLISQSSVDCTRSDYSTAFTAELVCPIPTEGVIPTIAQRSHIRVSYVLVVDTVVHSHPFQLDIPIIISPFPSYTTSDEEIQKIGPVPSLGGLPHYERPASNMLYAETLIERSGAALEESPLETIQEDDTHKKSPEPSHSPTSPAARSLGIDSPRYLHDSEIRSFVSQRNRSNSALSRSGQSSSTDLDRSHVFEDKESALMMSPKRFRDSNDSFPSLSPVFHTDTQRSNSLKQISYAELLTQLTELLRYPAKRKALLELTGDRAQVVVDFLDSALMTVDLSQTHLRKHILITLYRICKASQCHPKSHTLHNIAVGPQEAGGGFCNIHRARYRDQVLYLKVIRPFKNIDTEGVIKLLSKEAIIWGQLNHPNILPFYGVYYLGSENKRTCMVSPWMENGNIMEYIQDNPSVSRRSFICDIITGLEYLHERNIIHGDLKGTNVLISGSGRACITDFGLSPALAKKSITAEAATILTAINSGSYPWMAPEVLKGDSRPTQESDVWSFGCLSYQICMRRVPYHEAPSNPAVIKMIMSGKTPMHYHSTGLVPAIDTINDEMEALLRRCWTPPVDRPTCREVMEILGIADLAGIHGTRIDTQSFEFRRIMKNKGSSPIDLPKVGCVLKEIAGDEEDFLSSRTRPSN
ncbi:hypothetical protein NP233_g6609 [Leucocoprinus birnbaumii]|uniref:Protein kinase domain-containing protein n=1 Tax=Leucocoprinus birnbaumii TaxID=56174 RepID=A0AAD5VRS9_9AGAR|nr:hypothetical protein NP233_g6609 [Leucocoprinus birnbaumii]